MNSKIILVAIVLLIIIGGGAFLLTKNSSMMHPAMVATPTPTQAMMKMESTPTASPSEMMMMKTSGTPTPSETMTPSGAMMKESGKVESFTVTGSNFKFAPATLTVKKGDTVKITFASSGGMHDFVIDEFNVKTAVIPSGQTATVSFVADKAGKFDYYCSVANHRAMGMQGVLTVE